MTILDFLATTTKVEKISSSMMRALRAVETGEVFRRFTGKTDKMVGPMGIGTIQFWRCCWAKLIEDGQKITGDGYVAYQQVLTETGKQALETGLFDASR